MIDAGQRLRLSGGGQTHHKSWCGFGMESRNRNYDPERYGHRQVRSHNGHAVSSAVMNKFNNEPSRSRDDDKLLILFWQQQMKKILERYGHVVPKKEFFAISEQTFCRR
jgi:hypothetical protein